MHNTSFEGGQPKIDQLRSKYCAQPAYSMNTFSTGKNAVSQRKLKGDKDHSPAIRFLQHFPQLY